MEKERKERRSKREIYVVKGKKNVDKSKTEEKPIVKSNKESIKIVEKEVVVDLNAIKIEKEAALARASVMASLFSNHMKAKETKDVFVETKPIISDTDLPSSTYTATNLPFSILLRSSASFSLYLKNGDEMEEEIRKNLKRALILIYKEMIVLDVKYSREKHIERSLWTLTYEELDVHIKSLKDNKQVASASNSIFHSLSSARHKEDLQEAIKISLRDYTDFIQRLMGITPQTQDVNFMIHSFFINLGDISRYKELYKVDSSAKPDWSIAQSFYKEALKFYTEEGKVLNQLAVLSQYTKNIWKASFYFFSALGVEKPFPSRENLSSILNKVMREDDGKKKTFKTSFLKVIAILFSKVGIDGLNKEREEMRVLLLLLLEKRDVDFDFLFEVATFLILVCENSRIPLGLSSQSLQKPPTFIFYLCVSLIYQVTSCLALSCKKCFQNKFSPSSIDLLHEKLLSVISSLSLYLDKQEGRLEKEKDEEVSAYKKNIDMYRRECILNLEAISRSVNQSMKAVDPKKFSPNLILPEDTFLITIKSFRKIINEREICNPLETRGKRISTLFSLLIPSPSSVVAPPLSFDKGKEVIKVQVVNDAKKMEKEEEEEEEEEEHGEVEEVEAGVFKGYTENEEEVEDDDEDRAREMAIDELLGLDIDDKTDGSDDVLAAVVAKSLKMNDTKVDEKSNDKTVKERESLKKDVKVVVNVEVPEKRKVDESVFELPASKLDKECPACFNTIERNETLCPFCEHSFVKAKKEEEIKEELKGSGMFNIPKHLSLHQQHPQIGGKKKEGGRRRDKDDEVRKREYEGRSRDREEETKKREYEPPVPSSTSLKVLASSFSAPKHLIVIDASNVAMRHGLNECFSSQGISIVIQYFTERGHRVISFIPDYVLNYDKVGELKRASTLGFAVSKSKIPSDVTLLKKLITNGTLVATPPQDYDDSYCIHYAKNNGGIIVSNDMYRDAIDKEENNKKNALKRWFKSHCISYTFAGEEFLPNPDFYFPY